MLFELHSANQPGVIKCAEINLAGTLHHDAPLFQRPVAELNRLLNQLEALPNKSYTPAEQACWQLVRAAGNVLPGYFADFAYGLPTGQQLNGITDCNDIVRQVCDHIVTQSAKAQLPLSTKISCYQLASKKKYDTAALRRMSKALTVEAGDPRFIRNCLLMHALVTDTAELLFSDDKLIGGQCSPEYHIWNSGLSTDVKDVYRDELLPAIRAAKSMLIL